MNATDAWARFRDRILASTVQQQTLRAWQRISALTKLPPNDAVEQLTKLVMEQLDEPAFQTFRNAMILVNVVYSQRAGVAGIQDPEEWQRRYLAYRDSGDPEAPQYENYFNLRAALDRLRKPQDQSPPYDAEELALGARCNELFNSLGPALTKISPKTVTRAAVDELVRLIETYRALLAAAKPECRTRRMAVDAVAQATYALGRAYLIFKEYARSAHYYQAALDEFEALNDTFNAQSCRRQLAALSVLSGNIDEAMRANLELLTGELGRQPSLERAGALIDQLKHALDVGDTFEARKLLNSALDELDAERYPDPYRLGIEPAFKIWVETVPAQRCGPDFMNELAQVVQFYAATLAARARLDADGQAEQQLESLKGLLNVMWTEALRADADLQKRFSAANERPLAASAAGPGS